MSADQNNNLASGSAGASDESIQQVHADLMNKKPEPEEGFKLMPLFLLGFVSTMIFVTSVYVVHYRADFSPLVYDERFDSKAAAAAVVTEMPLEQVVAAGKKSFQQACAACHQVTGLGIAGVYPPLAGSEWVVGNEERLVRVLLHGLKGPIQVAGKNYNGVMPAFGKVIGGGYNWNEEKVAQVLTYIRQEWGNQAAPIAKATVSEVLAKDASRSSQWTAAELEQLK